MPDYMKVSWVVEGQRYYGYVVGCIIVNHPYGFYRRGDVLVSHNLNQRPSIMNPEWVKEC